MAHTTASRTVRIDTGRVVSHRRQYKQEFIPYYYRKVSYFNAFKW